MDTIRKPLLGLPSPTAYLRAPQHRPAFAPVLQTCGHLQAFRRICRGACDGGAHFSTRRKSLWRLSRKQGTPTRQLAAGAQVSEIHNADWSGTTSSSENSLSAEELFETFLRNRQYKSDFVSKASDILWKREVFDVDEEKLSRVRARLAELQKLREEDYDAGYLKLSQAKQWGLGVDGAPNNVRSEANEIYILDDDRRRVGLLEYEATLETFEYNGLREPITNHGNRVCSTSNSICSPSSPNTPVPPGWHACSSLPACLPCPAPPHPRSSLPQSAWWSWLAQSCLARLASPPKDHKLKRELSLITAAVAALCSIYCGVVLSSEAAVSYGIGALGSLLYLQLLFRHSDQVSEENVAAVFMRRRQKKIGIRSSDLQDAFVKAFMGSSYVLSSPRLGIPVALYGLWTLEHKLGFLQLALQITPMMFGFFAYKAALLVQAFRENKDLAMSFEKDKE